MFKVEFSLRHRGCLVNELSRVLPEIRFICPGGFITGPSSVEELIVIDRPSDSDVQSVLGYLKGLQAIAEVRLLERTADKVFIYFKALTIPESFCSQVVEKNHCFRIGTEIQHGGLEMWQVGCVERRQAEQLLKDLEGLGELKDSSISESSWQELLEGGVA